MPDPLSIPKGPRNEEEFSGLIEKGKDTSEPIGVPPPCISANRSPRYKLGLAGRRQERVESSGLRAPENLQVLA